MIRVKHLRFHHDIRNMLTNREFNVIVAAVRAEACFNMELATFDIEDEALLLLKLKHPMVSEITSTYCETTDA